MSPKQKYFSISITLLLCFITYLSLSTGNINRLPKTTLKDTQGKSWPLHNIENKTALVLLSFGIGCPLIRDIAQDYENLSLLFPNMAFFYLDSNRYNSIQALNKEAQTYHLQFPILKDTDQYLAKQLDIKRSGEALVVSLKNRKIIYHGPFNNNIRGCNTSSIQIKEDNFFLKAALLNIKKGTPPLIPPFKSLGCLIAYN